MSDNFGYNEIEINNVLKKLNEVSPYFSKTKLEELALSCDEGTPHQDLIKSFTFHLYASFNGSNFSQNRLIDNGYCPDYFGQIVEITENPMFESDNIISLIEGLASPLAPSLRSVRGIITGSFLFLDAIAAIGMIIFNNYQIGLEYDLAILLCRTAADSGPGQGKASFIVGNHYFGLKEYGKSFEYFERAVDMGDADAMYSLSGFYFNGIGGTPKNSAKAKELLTNSAKLGNQRAISALSRFFSK